MTFLISPLAAVPPEVSPTSSNCCEKCHKMLHKQGMKYSVGATSMCDNSGNGVSPLPLHP